LTGYEFASAVLLAKMAWKSSQAISLQVATGLELPPECGPPTGNDLSRNFRTAAIQHDAILSASTRCWCLVMEGGSWAYHAINPTSRNPPKTPSLELTVEHWPETTAASQKGVGHSLWLRGKHPTQKAWVGLVQMLPKQHVRML
jgi:hypothetical protein